MGVIEDLDENLSESQREAVAINEADIDDWYNRASIKLELRTRYEKQNAKHFSEGDYTNAY
jgi:hypothetical protein